MLPGALLPVMSTLLVSALQCPVASFHSSFLSLSCLNVCAVMAFFSFDLTNGIFTEVIKNPSFAPTQIVRLDADCPSLLVELQKQDCGPVCFLRIKAHVMCVFLLS